MVEAIAVVAQASVSALGFLERFFARLGAVPVWMSACMVVFACRYLLQPILGSVGSDFAREVKDQERSS